MPLTLLPLVTPVPASYLAPRRLLYKLSREGSMSGMWGLAGNGALPFMAVSLLLAIAAIVLVVVGKRHEIRGLSETRSGSLSAPPTSPDIPCIQHVKNRQ